MAKLYELTEQYDKLLNLGVDTETGELFDDETLFKAKLAEIQDAIEVKAENLGKVYLMLTAEAKQADDEIRRIEKIRNANRHNAQWIREYLLDQLQLAKIDSVEKPTIRINLRTNNPSVEVVDQSAIPEDYLRVIPAQYEADKVLILNHWKETKEAVPGANIITDKKRVDIK